MEGPHDFNERNKLDVYVMYVYVYVFVSSWIFIFVRLGYQ